MTDKVDPTLEHLRSEIEQEVNSISVGVDRSKIPKNLGILIPSLDLQKSIDRLLALFTKHSEQVEREARFELAAQLYNDDFEGKGDWRDTVHEIITTDPNKANLQQSNKEK